MWHRAWEKCHLRTPDRQEVAEPDQAATRGTSQIRLPRCQRERSGTAMSGGHEAAEGERGGGAGRGGAQGRGAQGTGFWIESVIVCAV
jgi:hypothetical protein